MTLFLHTKAKTKSLQFSFVYDIFSNQNEFLHLQIFKNISFSLKQKNQTN